MGLANVAQGEDLPAKIMPDKLAGPPLVSAKGWAFVDGKTGQFLWGEGENDPLVLASTTKIMTAWLVVDLQRKQPDILEQTLTVSAAAAKTEGSSAKIQEGDRFEVKELLYGLMLPSGNDAATAFAEHCGKYYRQQGDPDGDAEAFVAQMNRQAEAWKLKQTRYFDPHGLGKNHASTANLAHIAYHALQNPVFREIVQTRRRESHALDAKDEKRAITWINTNRMLGTEGFHGVKTGTTTAAGSCLVSSAQRGGDHLILALLGSTTSDNRYMDTRNLFRWAWRERGHKDS
jgi:D-alanyl-D-alanine carboxypeptidase (penicillin-binding protein 5/6)